MAYCHDHSQAPNYTTTPAGAKTMTIYRITRVAIFGGLLCGCTASPSRVEPSAAAQPLTVIETKWSVVSVNVCETPTALAESSRCPSIKPGVPVSVLEKRKDYLGRDIYVVEGDGHKGFISSDRYNWLSREDPKVTAARAAQKKAAEKSDCDRRGGVRVGKTRE